MPFSHRCVTRSGHPCGVRTAATLAAALLLAACAAPLRTELPTATASPSAPPGSPSTSASPSTPPASGWTLVSHDGGPSARADHSFTIDGAGEKAYLFGGHATDGSLLGDLWELDLASDRWREIDASGPAPRFGHNAAWVDGVGLVVFAGQGARFYSDVWAFKPDAARWRRLAASGDIPVPRYGSCAAVGPDGRLWISHGFTSEGSRFADTKAYDFETGSWVDETPAGDRPVERCLHACWWTADGRLALFGGQTTGIPALGDLWHLSQGPRPGTNAWSMADVPSGLRPRQLYASARWGNSTIVFGGGALNGGYVDDTWQVTDRGRARRLRVGHGPGGRAGAELIADPARHRMLLFGGTDADGASADLWALRLPES
jgi:hypothetical protein